MRSYTNWLYTLAIILVTCALIWSNTCLKEEWNELEEERAQLIDQIRQMDIKAAEILRRNKMYEEDIKGPELRDVR